MFSTDIEAFHLSSDICFDTKVVIDRFIGKRSQYCFTFMSDLISDLTINTTVLLLFVGESGGTCEESDSSR